MRKSRLLLGLVTLTVISTCVTSALAQPAGWQHSTPLGVDNPNAALSDQQVKLVVDTAALVSAGKMAADGSDIRFGTSCDGATLVPYWINPPTMNGAATEIWIKTNLPAGNSPIFLFSGNVSAPAVSSLTSVFEGDSNAANAPYSATTRVTGLMSGGVGNSQRGFRFKPNEDVLLVSFGKNEPTGSTRWITLFDWATQAKVLQGQVSGPAAQYSYQSMTPTWLKANTEYTLQLYQDSADGYYFGSSSQIDPRLTYIDMRYCNGCTKDTFPTNYLNNFHYGTPDFEFLTFKQTALPIVQAAPVCTNTALCDSDCSPASCGDGFTNSAAGEACDDADSDETDACTNQCAAATCGDSKVQAGVEECDDGNSDDTDGCLSTCLAAKCGDGKVQAGVEACDDGNAVETDGCLSTCVLAKCGDGKVQAGVEECDDGNTVDGDTCSSTCKIPKPDAGVKDAGTPPNNVDAGRKIDDPTLEPAPADASCACRSASTTTGGESLLGFGALGVGIVAYGARRRRRG